MNNRFKMIFVLTLIAVISGSVLSLVYLASYPNIKANALKEQRKAIYRVVPNTKDFVLKEKDGFSYFECRDTAGEITGIALPAEGSGYQGKIKLMIGLTPELTQILGVLVLEQLETPGLGGRISESTFQDQFRGIGTKSPIIFVKNIKHGWILSL